MLCRRYAGAIVLDPPQHRPVRLAPQGHGDAGRRGRMVDRILDQVRHHLGEKVRISGNLQRVVHLKGQRMPGIGGHLSVDVADPRRQGRQVGCAEPLPAHAGFHLGDAQQGVEGFDDPVGLGNGVVHRGIELGRRRRMRLEAVQPLSQPCQRGTQIVRDVGGHLPQAVHQPLDPRHHDVDMFGQTVDLVAAWPDGQAPVETARRYLSRQRQDGVHTGGGFPAQRETRDEGADGDGDAAHEQAEQHDLLRLVQDMRIAAGQHLVGPHCFSEAEQADFVVAVHRGRVLQVLVDLHDGVRQTHFLPAFVPYLRRDVAGDHPPVFGQQVEIVTRRAFRVLADGKG
ncbi:hypothetical protein LA66_10945 [Aureimonas altamirensis]|uniref:Uncharacterized protein n=1 Tax=Aureimonas altamirensis TaxID=370622 RepID=A0A0B1Q882_9HYPH|nr:hypothetical protein LA66_10945 [Aureimonas altamirensis]